MPDYGALLHSFFSDKQTQIILLLIAVDFILGVVAAFKLGTFRLAYVSDFARNDILEKVLPFFVLQSADKVAGNQDIVIPGFSLGIVVAGAFGIITLAMIGSILSSLKDLDLLSNLPASLGRGENPTA